MRLAGGLELGMSCSDSFVSRSRAACHLLQPVVKVCRPFPAWAAVGKAKPASMGRLCPIRQMGRYGSPRLHPDAVQVGARHSPLQHPAAAAAHVHALVVAANVPRQLACGAAAHGAVAANHLWDDGTDEQQQGKVGNQKEGSLG